MNIGQYIASWIPWLYKAEQNHEQRISALEGKVKKMADVLDKLDADFKAYQALVTSTLSDLRAKIAALAAGTLDPAKAQAIDDEIVAATAAVTPAP